MRAVVDTNILVSALLARHSLPWQVVQAWSHRRFVLLTCDLQVAELKRTLRKPELAARITPREAGRIVNDLWRLAERVDPLPFVRRSLDPDDDYLLSMVQAGSAGYLVTGDKGDLLVLRTHAGAKIVTARVFLDVLG